MDGVKVVSSDHIKDLANKVGKDEVRSLRYLQEHGYIHWVLRGTFYIRGPEEIESGSLKYSIYEMISEALRLKGVKNWYFGLETALKMNRMTHEYFTVDYVITDSFRTTKVIGILDSKFKFIKWSMRGDSAEWRRRSCHDRREVLVEKCRALMTRSIYKHRDSLDLYMIKRK